MFGSIAVKPFKIREHFHEYLHSHSISFFTPYHIPQSFTVAHVGNVNRKAKIYGEDSKDCRLPSRAKNSKNKGTHHRCGHDTIKDVPHYQHGENRENCGQRQPTIKFFPLFH